MTIRILVLTLTPLLALPAFVMAQPGPPPVSQPAPQRVPLEPVSSPGGTYIKVGLGHWQGDVFNSDSLTQWSGDPFGSDYNLTSVEVEVESYFDRAHLLLSGWAVGYRKDAISRIDSGHMLHASAFRSLGFKAFAVRIGSGLEWGLPSLNFDTTAFDSRADGALRYHHTYPSKNVDVPGVGTTKDGALYPFLELSLVERLGGLLLEAGMRVNIVRFHFDTYEVGPDDQLTYGFSSSKVAMPMLFVNVGFKAF